MHSIWEELSQHWILSYCYSSNMLITPLSSGQDILQLYIDILALGNWAIWNRSLKRVVGALGQIVPIRMFIYIARKELHKCGLGICPMVMKIHSLVSANAASAEHVLQTLLAFWRFIISLCSRQKRQKKYHRQFSLTVHPVPGHEVKVFVQHHDILVQVLGTSWKPVIHLFIHM